MYCESKNPSLREVLQALLDGKEVCGASACWRDLAFFENTPRAVIHTDHTYQIRDKVRPHVHAEIIKAWVENPAAYRVDFSEAGAWFPLSGCPRWMPEHRYRLVDAKTGEHLAESKGAK